VKLPVTAPAGETLNAAALAASASSIKNLFKSTP
jgi:hypothetical protein